MKANIMILNALHYEKDGKDGSCLSFIFCDKEYFDDSENYLGYTVVNQFYNGNIREKLTKEIIGKPVEVEIDVVKSFKNPLKTYQKIRTINHNGKSINLF